MVHSASDLGRSLTLRVARVAASPWPVRGAVLGVLLGIGCLMAAAIPVGPTWLGPSGAVLVATVYAWALAAREGGRPVVFGTVALVLGVTAVLADQDVLRTGAAVMTATVAAVLGVMITVPTKGAWAAAGEAVVALAVASVGAVASVAFEPAIDLERYQYVSLGLALFGVFLVVYRLGAGFHGLGRRGFAMVAIGAVVLSATLLYTELLRSYGSQALVDDLVDLVQWSRESIGAFPRPITALLGVPAIVYGCHVRARRRQGWWICAFGVAATSAAATSLGDPAMGMDEAALAAGYGLVIGVLVGWVAIRLDLIFTGNSGRRRRVAEQEHALRPEPGRTSALL